MPYFMTMFEFETKVFDEGTCLILRLKYEAVSVARYLGYIPTFEMYLENGGKTFEPAQARALFNTSLTNNFKVLNPQIEGIAKIVIHDRYTIFFEVTKLHSSYSSLIEIKRAIVNKANLVSSVPEVCP